MVSSWLLRRVALVRTDVSEELQILHVCNVCSPVEDLFDLLSLFVCPETTQELLNAGTITNTFNCYYLYHLHRLCILIPQFHPYRCTTIVTVAKVSVDKCDTYYIIIVFIHL
jgi:hypothetical protein